MPIKLQTVFVLFHNWESDSQTLVFKTQEKSLKIFEKLVREQIDPGLEFDDIESRVAEALKRKYFEYSGDGTERNPPSIQIDELALN